MYNKKYNVATKPLERNAMIDIFKFVCAFFVVGIHTNVFSEVSSEFNFFFTQIIGRVAVPFFIVTTGYFIGKQLTFNNGRVENTIQNKMVVLKNVKQIFFLYTIWSFVYLVPHVHNWIEIDWFSVHSFLDWGIAFIRNGSYYHLWYLLAMIYGLIVAYFMFRLVYLRFYPILIIILYAIEVILYAYRAFVPAQFEKLFAMADYFGCITTGCVCMLPFIMLGIYISQKKNFAKKNYCFLLLSFIFQIIETFILRLMGQDKYSYIILTLPVAYFLFQTIYTRKVSVNIDTRLFAKSSMIIYCIHPLFIYFLKPIITNTTILFIVVSILSVIAAFLWIVIEKYRSELK